MNLGVIILVPIVGSVLASRTIHQPITKIVIQSIHVWMKIMVVAILQQSGMWNVQVTIIICKNCLILVEKRYCMLTCCIFAKYLWRCKWHGPNMSFCNCLYETDADGRCKVNFWIFNILSRAFLNMSFLLSIKIASIFVAAFYSLCVCVYF